MSIGKMSSEKMMKYTLPHTNYDIQENCVLEETLVAKYSL